LNYVSIHKEERAKQFGLTRKEAKIKRENFIFGKKRKRKNVFDFFITILRNV
jgi:predicted Zn-dependent protease